MAITYHAMSTSQYGTQSITANTDKRDVSDMLDLWAHEETPFLNRLSWGEESGGLTIEWLYEHLGWGYLESTGAVASNAASVTMVEAHTPTASLDSAVKSQLQEGCMLYAYSASDAEHGVIIIESVDSGGTVTFEWLVTTSLAASTKFYIVGNFANEGSTPRPDISRPRTLLSNNFTILRKDVEITGSQAATDMYAVSNELRHQIRLRLLEMQREREMTVLYSTAQARSTTAAAYMNGLLGFLKGQTGSNIDTTTTSLTETAFNNMVAACAENRGKPKVLVANLKHIRAFTNWDRSRVRTSPDTRIGGSYITHYLSDVGMEIELIWVPMIPVNVAFLLDTNKIKLRAKKGRKLIVEKLGKVGDFEQWQMISEFSMEFRGYNLGQHGMFSALT